MKSLRDACPLVLLVVLVRFSSPADEIDNLLQQEMSDHRIPGMALAIIHRGVAVKTACYGLANLELGTPVKTNTVFEIGSITKQFTATCILLLQQQGKLSVEDRIAELFFGADD